MKYYIALAPNLCLNANDFVNEWNTIPECNTVATASLDNTSRTFSDLFVDFAIATLITLGSGISTNAIYDLLKARIQRMLAKRNVHKHTTFKQIDKPDGTHIIIITIDEE